MINKEKASNIGSKKPIDIVAKTFINDNIFVCFNAKKEPFMPIKLIPARCNDPLTWGSYKQALFTINNMNKTNYLKGIGIELGKTSKGNLCGIDIDKCIDDNGNIDPNAQEIINLFDTYTELSINGKGIHILFFGNKKENVCKNNKLSWCEHIEIYDNKRFFTLSGKQINNKNIEYRQEQCNFAYEKYFISNNPINDNLKQRRKTAKNFTAEKISNYKEHFKSALSKDKKLSNYYNGKRPSNDESSNDLGFCSKLAHWLKNYYLVEDYFLNSPYFQLKDQKHKDKCLKRKDYLQRTITLALRGVNK